MPATAGRVRMPANNRVHSSAALQTHGIWQSAIGYDPYAPTSKDDSKNSARTVSAAEPEGENAYASFQGLLQLAKITNSNSDEARGACKKCGRVGHLTFQCRNFLSVKDDLNKDVTDDDVIREVVLGKLKGEKVKLKRNITDKVESGESSEEEEEEESESSDSDYDSEMERIIAEKYGKKSNLKGNLSSGKKEEDGEGEKRTKRGRSKKRRSRKMESSDSEDEDDGGRGRRSKKRKEKRSRRDDDSSDDGKDQRRKRKTRQEKRRRRSHRHSSEDSENSSDGSPEKRHKRRTRRVSSPSGSDISVSDDSRIGRDKRRAEKNSRKRHRERES